MNEICVTKNFAARALTFRLGMPATSMFSRWSGWSCFQHWNTAITGGGVHA
ncbi:hypothetical protein GGQ85_004351 [Nitrobacter vulgaris]|nr:hypothetical protein [Nitrobacter vulgaris]